MQIKKQANLIISGLLVAFGFMGWLTSAYGAPACGTPLQWNTPNGVWANQAVWNYLHQDDPQLSASLQPNELQVAYVDLNKDASPEIIYLAQNSMYCGAHGCRMEILTQDKTNRGLNKTWRPLLSLIASDVSLGATYTRGYRDVYVNGLKLWQWMGTGYDIVFRPAPTTSWVDSQKPDCSRKAR